MYIYTQMHNLMLMHLMLCSCLCVWSVVCVQQLFAIHALSAAICYLPANSFSNSSLLFRFSISLPSPTSYITYECGKQAWLINCDAGAKAHSNIYQHTQMITHIHTYTDTCIHTPSLALRPCKYPFGFEGEATFCCLSVWCTESCLRAAPFLLFIYFIFALFLPFWLSFADNSLPHEFFFF